MVVGSLLAEGVGEAALILATPKATPSVAGRPVAKVDVVAQAEVVGDSMIAGAAGAAAKVETRMAARAIRCFPKWSRNCPGTPVR